jgi:hypothetical protein
VKELVTLFKTHQGVLNKRARILDFKPRLGCLLDFRPSAHPDSPDCSHQEIAVNLYIYLFLVFGAVFGLSTFSYRHIFSEGHQLSPNTGQAQTPSTRCQALRLGADPSGLLHGHQLKLADKRLLTTRAGDNGSREEP